MSDARRLEAGRERVYKCMLATTRARVDCFFSSSAALRARHVSCLSLLRTHVTKDYGDSCHCLPTAMLLASAGAHSAAARRRRDAHRDEDARRSHCRRAAGFSRRVLCGAWRPKHGCCGEAPRWLAAAGSSARRLAEWRALAGMLSRRQCHRAEDWLPATGHAMARVAGQACKRQGGGSTSILRQ